MAAASVGSEFVSMKSFFMKTVVIFLLTSVFALLIFGTFCACFFYINLFHNFVDILERKIYICR